MNVKKFFLGILAINLVVIIFYFNYLPQQNNDFLSIPENNLKKKITPAFHKALKKKQKSKIQQQRNKNKKSVTNSMNHQELTPITINFNQNILQQIGVYKTLKSQYYNDDPSTKPNFTLGNMGLINDNEYCNFIDYQNFQVDPKRIINQMDFITDYNADGLARQLVMKQIGNDLFNDSISKDMSKDLWFQQLYTIPQNGTMIFTKKVRFHYYHQYGKNLFCESQMFNHIPGHGSLTRKDLNIESVKTFTKKMKNKPQCFNSKSFFPSSYRLDNATECIEFFEYIDSDEYKEIRKKEPVTFLSKISWGASRGLGIELVNEQYEKRLRRKYQNGKLCGQIIDNILTQTYISNPLTVKGHKFDFRIYMLVASTDPLTVYYHDGFLRISMLKYDRDSKEKTVHLTNTHLAKGIFADPEKYRNQTGLDEQAMRDFQMWGMERFQDYLLEIGKIKDKNWLDNYLRPAFKKAFIQLVMMTQNQFLKRSNVFEIFGLDFLLDENLNLWFLECNASPVFQGTSKEKEIFQTTMLKDMFYIQHSYLKSKTKRITNFFDQIKADVKNKKQLYKEDLLNKYNEINRNTVEKEYQIKKSTFVKIVDFKETGKNRFGGLFEESCFDDK